MTRKSTSQRSATRQAVQNQNRNCKAVAEVAAKKMKGAAVAAEQLLAAVESLYADEICPHSQILKRRIVELSSNGSFRTADIDSGALRALVAATPRLELGPEEVRDWTVVLSDREPTFVDVHDPCDAYSPGLWQAFDVYLQQNSLECRLPSSRYACALELRDRALPFLLGSHSAASATLCSCPSLKGICLAIAMARSF